MVHAALLVGAASLLLAPLGVRAQAPAVWGDPALEAEGVVLPRHPAPSPDGTQIAFSYQGDLWVVPSGGGEARRLTAHTAFEGHPVWSPDGQWIAFASDRAGTHDVYILPVAGGPVRQLTFNSYQDIPKDWTPDGRGILFRSWRYMRDGDNPGIFYVSLEGGTPLAVLPVGGRDPVLAPDGIRLAFTRGGGTWTRRGYVGNGRQRLWLAELEEALGSSGSAHPPRRSGRRASGVGADRIATGAALQADAALRPGGSFRNLTELGRIRQGPEAEPGRQGFWAGRHADGPDFSRPALEPGVNSDPHWFPDGRHLLYLSEMHGIANLKVMSVESGERTWVTRLEEGRMRLPRLSRNGRLAAFEYEDGIYTVELPAELPADGAFRWSEPPAAPRRLAIQIPLDRKAPRVEWLSIRSGASEFALSPDDKQIAFVAEGEVFVMKASEEEPYAYNVSESPARDGELAWMPDGEGLVFVSDRAGQHDLYRVRSSDENEPRLARTLHRELERLTDDARAETHPRISPDGEWIAYRRGEGTLMVMDADGNDAEVLVEGPHEIDFAWSPDSRWLLYTQEDDDYNMDIWIIAADGTEGPHNISRHPDSDFSARWSPDGKMIAFASIRTFLNQTDIWYVWLTRADEERSREERLDLLAGDKPDPKKDEDEDEDEDQDEADDGGDEEEELVVEIDFADIHTRLHRLTTFPGRETDVLISKDASELVFVADTDGKRDLWKVKWDGSDPERLTTGGQNPRFMQWNKKHDKVFYIKGRGAIAAVPLSGGSSKSYGYEAELAIDRLAQRAYVFDEAWRALRENFYDPDFHGCDWDAMHAHYRPWALGASTYADFQDVLRMLLGELNASHLGTWSGPGDPSSRGDALPAATGELGILLDAADEGPGVRIVHIIKGSPADRVESRLEIGERILAVNGVALEPGENFWRRLARAAERRTVLTVADRDGDEREVVIRPILGAAQRELVYDEEVELRQHYVAERTDGKVAYVHIRRMGESSLDQFERDLYAQAHGKRALIIDVRDNPGGWITDLLLTSLMAAEHATAIGRGAGPGYPEGRRLLYAWTRPIVVLCDEYSFSNAEIFSWAVRTLDRGPVVGQQTFGGVISTGGMTLLDGSWLRLPFRGWYTLLDGSNQEGTGCIPDIEVVNLPGRLLDGVDSQLDRAIAEAVRQIEE